ncbi:hypothetical protein C2S53_019741 [Perilla frutescens var. hirtella]|uniref:Uncharacterized protein n=1 Tax=Perilla frutescens var. hirtella TaxID=608512 RepID=A0AAD4J064_PERFH|nr:hypothetical protein C2S53_019741 [Perilla frutescens var. hirtella]
MEIERLFWVLIRQTHGNRAALVKERRDLDVVKTRQGRELEESEICSLRPLGRLAHLAGRAAELLGPVGENAGAARVRTATGRLGLRESAGVVFTGMKFSIQFDLGY